jgi:hypothetical protein
LSELSRLASLISLADVEVPLGSWDSKPSVPATLTRTSLITSVPVGDEEELFESSITSLDLMPLSSEPICCCCWRDEE